MSEAVSSLTRASGAVVRPTAPADLSEVRELHDSVFGPGAYTRTAYRIREGAPAISPFCLVSRIDDRLVASVRFTEVTVGGDGGVLLLGPLCVDPRWAGQGYGKALVANGLERAKTAGRRAVLLVGETSYYGRFGFSPVTPVGRIALPGPVNLGRLLAVELVSGAGGGLGGLVMADSGGWVSAHTK